MRVVLWSQRILQILFLAMILISCKLLKVVASEDDEPLSLTRVKLLAPTVHLSYEQCIDLKYSPIRMYYDSVTIFWPYSNNYVWDENSTNSIEHILIGLIKAKVISDKSMVRIVFNDLTDYEKCDNCTVKKPQFVDAYMKDICQDIRSDETIKLGLTKYITTGQISNDLGPNGAKAMIADKLFVPSEEKHMHPYELVTTYLAMWAHLNETYNQDLVNLMTGFRSRQFRRDVDIHKSELDVYPIKKPKSKSRKLVVIANSEKDYQNYISWGNSGESSINKLFDMGYDSTEEGQVNYDINKQTENYGAFQDRDYNVNENINTVNNSLTYNVGPYWAMKAYMIAPGKGLPFKNPNFKFSKVLDMHNQYKDYYLTCGNNEKTPISEKDCDLYKKMGADVLQANLHVPRSVLERRKYSPIYHIVNGYNEKRNVLEAIQLIAHKKAYLTGYATSLMADLLMAYGTNKIIQINIASDTNYPTMAETEIGSNVYALQSLISITGCITNYDDNVIGMMNRSSKDYKQKFKDAITSSLCGAVARKKRFSAHESLCTSLSETFNNLVDIYNEPENTRVGYDQDYVYTIGFSNVSSMDDISSYNLQVRSLSKLHEDIASNMVSNIRAMTLKNQVPIVTSSVNSYLIPSLHPKAYCLGMHGLNIRQGSLKGY